MSPYFGETQKEISSIFEAARKHYRPVILFFDDIDGLFGEHKDSQSIDMQNITTFKQEIDDNKDYLNLVIIGATNHFDKICDAIKSRFSNQYNFNLPNYAQRKKFFKNKFNLFANKLDDEDFSDLAKKTNGKSFRDLEIFTDLIKIAAQLNEEAKYYVVDHGFDIEGNEKDFLYVAVSLKCEESIYVEDKNNDFMSNLAQVPITEDIVDFYLRNMRNIYNVKKCPDLPYYVYPVFDKNSIINESTKKLNLENKIKKHIVVSILLRFTLFIILCLLTNLFFKNQIKRNLHIKLFSLIINAIISYSLIKKNNPTGETDIEKPHPIVKYSRTMPFSNYEEHFYPNYRQKEFYPIILWEESLHLIFRDLKKYTHINLD